MKSAKSTTNRRRLLQSDCHIGIVGSGLGGLAAALAILQCDTSDVKKQKKHHTADGNLKSSSKEPCDTPSSKRFQGKITIYERDQHATDRKEGYGMTLTYNPSGPLAQLGILESIARQDCPSRSHYLFNEKGDVMGYYGNAFHGATSDPGDDDMQSALRGAGQRGNLRIPRSDLRNILMEKIKEVDSQNELSRVHMAWGKRLLSYVDRPAQEKLNQLNNSGKADNKQNVCACRRPVLLHFEDGTTDEVDLLIGADGVNSVVARHYLWTKIPAKSEQPTPSADPAPKYTGIFIIIGISDHMHPLIDERGYYTLDGERRLFIMPFAGNRLDNQRRRTMWQLSYPVADRNEAVRLSRLSPKELQNVILNLCGGWHEPFPDMVKQTPLDTIWGTGLLDRDPDVFIRHRQLLEIHGRMPSHVVLLGDAAHAMTPFKGQGANQALTDGPLLAKWLSQAKFESAIRGFMTEMARRSGVKVKASREAAMKLHSKDCWKWISSQDGVDNNAIFHGVKPDSVQTLLRELRTRSIGASLGSALDGHIHTVIKQLSISNTVARRVSPQELHCLEEQALTHALHGDLVSLRELSRESQFLVQKVLDARHRSCLHVAAAKGHHDVCRWLLSEARVDPKVRDENNKTALDVANECGHNEIALLIQSYLKRAIPDGEQASYSEETCDEILVGQDLYRQIEQQLRAVRTIKELRSLLQNNRQNTSNDHLQITHVLGCPIDNLDKEIHRDRELALAREHGAVVLRNFVSREVDQLALGAIAMRPLCLDIPHESDLRNLLQPGVTKKKVRKQIEEIKSRISIPADSPIIVQTNFAPQIMSQNSGNASKKRKVESVSLSKLRYLNLGEYNYNWGDRKYDKIPGALPFPTSFTALARRAYDLAQQEVKRDCQSETCNKSAFDMAICNFYHLHRPSDRLGGHKDDVESDLTSPLITISLGAPGVFLLGGKSRSSVPTAILLRAGDAMILSGSSRQFFHGVPTILEYEENQLEQSMLKNEIIFPELAGDWLSESTASVQSSGEAHDINPSFNEFLFMKVFLTTARMNISIRRI